MADAAMEIEVFAETTVERIKGQMSTRSVRASNELLNAKNLTLRGRGSGRRYRVPNTRRYYTASAPGEVPAARTGQFRARWDAKSYGVGGAFGSSYEAHSQIESKVRTAGGKHNLGQILEEGTPGGQMSPRPYQDKIVEKAKPKIIKIYKEKYL